MDREWKSKSKYIKKNEREEIFAGVERRKQLQEELKELKQHSSIDPSKSTDFETSVIIGERLLALTKGVKTGENVIVSDSYRHI